MATASGSVSAPYVLTRAQDMNAPSEIPGAFALVEHGTANADTGWFVASPGPFTLGTTAIVWAYQSGGLVLDTTDNAQPLGAAAPGSTGKAADAGHIHPNTNVINGVTVSGSPGSGKTIVGTSSSAATWQAADTVAIDSNSGDITSLGASAAAGAVGLAADSGHVHPYTSNIGGVAVSGTAANGRVPIATSSSAAAWTLPLQIDTTATDIQPLGTRSAGSLTQAAAADHIHATTSIIDGVTVSGTPVAGEVMVATSGTAATWQVPQGQLTPTAVKTSAYTANPLDFVPVDTTSGSVTVTLPNAPANLTMLGVKLIILAGSNTVTVASAGSDVFNKSGGSVTLVLTRALQTVVLLYHSGIWYVTATDPAISLDTTSGDIAALGAQAAGSTAKAADAGHVHPVTGLVTSVAATDTSVVVTNGSTNSPTVATATLDVIAAQHPPAASVAMNSQKLTSLANGSASGDSVPLSQVKAITAAMGQSGGVAACGYVAGMSSPVSGVNPAVPAARWTSGTLWGQIMFALPGVAVNGFITLAPWGAGALANTFVGLYNSSGTQLGVTADLSAQSANTRGIHVAVTGFTTTPADGIIIAVYLNGTSASNAGPYVLQGQAYNNGYPSTLPSGGKPLGFSLAGSATSLPGSITMSGGWPSGWADVSPTFFQAFLD